MNILNRLITFMFFGVVLCGASPPSKPDVDLIGEFRSLVALAPTKRTKEQKARIRDIWRSSEKARVFFHGASVLQAGDSVLDFPGVLQGKTIEYDVTKREYVFQDRFSTESGDGGNDHWEIVVKFSEDGIVTSNQRMKMNSR